MTQEHAHRGDAFVRKLVTFGRILREAGLEVRPGRMQDALLGLAAVDLTNRDDVYWALRCTIVSRRDDIEVFDAAFAAFWERAPRVVLQQRPIELGVELPEENQKDESPEAVDAHALGREVRDGEDPEQESGDDKEEAAAAVWSADDLLRDRDFARYGPDELRRARCARGARGPRRAAAPFAAKAAFAERGDVRPAAHPARGDAHGWRADRASLARAQAGAAQARLPGRRLRVDGAVRARDGDVPAGGRACGQARRGLHVRHAPDAAHAAPGRAGSRSRARERRAGRARLGGWTHIGENLKAFNDVWGRRGLTRGAIVVIASDGWERGDPTLLAEQMRRLHLAAHRIVWTNPLAGGEGYRPLVAGMQAALPYVDDFLPGHNLRALETLADVLEEIDEGPRSPRADRLRLSA